MNSNAFQDLEKNIRSDPYNSVVFQAGSSLDIYLVGGYTRDLISGRGSSDRDYVVAGPMEGLLKEVTLATDGRLIELGGGALHRIVVRNGGTLDFTPLRGEIEKDLACRDFTINSIAWSPGKGWIDPTGGIDDLQRGLLRMVDGRNLVRDPLRILRAYRFAGEFSLEIDSATRTALRRFAVLISKTCSERITSEFFKILNLTEAPLTLEMMLGGGLLTSLISGPYRDLERQVKVLDKLYRKSYVSPLKYKFSEMFSQGLMYRGLLGLEMLLEGLPSHLFALSSKILKRIICIKRASEVVGLSGLRSLSREALFDLFEIAREAAPDFLLIRDLTAHLDALDEYRRIQREGLLTAEEVKSAIGIGQGAALGKAIRAVKEAEFAGHISTREAAFDFLRGPIA
jgi:tRNA nucleotidyltransferase (CCA-adding enzyme)